MATSFRRFSASLLSVLILLAAQSARATDVERIRIESTYLRPLVAGVTAHSQTFRRLVDDIQRSDVIAYVTCEHFRSSTLRGRTRFVVGGREVRYVRVEVDCMQPTADVVAIIGHEFRHLAEIAGAATVMDERSLRTLYMSIGFQTCGFWRAEQFETSEAERTGERVRREYAGRMPAH